MIVLYNVYPVDVNKTIDLKSVPSDRWRIHYDCPSCGIGLWVFGPLSGIFGLPHCVSCLRKTDPFLSMFCKFAFVVRCLGRSELDDGLIKPFAWLLPSQTPLTHAITGKDEGAINRSSKLSVVEAVVNCGADVNSFSTVR